MKQVIAVALLASAIAAPADAAVKYVFTATSSSSLVGEQITNAGFTLVLPDFLTTDTTFPVASMENCFVATTAQPAGATCGSADLYLSNTYNYIGLEVNTLLNPMTYQYYYFTPGAFGTPGSYEAMVFGEQQGAQLDVSRVSDAVPEPATWAMMLLGFGLIGGAMRSARRRRSSIDAWA